MSVERRIPVTFQKVDDTSDSRFQKVKIWLMHTGENMNNSYFSKESVQAAIPSLANTPILGYIENNDSGEEDFSDHRNELVREKGKWSLKYVGSAFGVIPENHNAAFEKRLCDDGIEREFLTCDGLMWTKWDDPIDILNRDIVKSQSMELHQDYEGHFDKKDNLFHFTKFKFFGACALGLDYNPAMHSATIEKFSYQEQLDNIREEIMQKMEEYKTYTAQRPLSNEGGNVVDEDKNEVVALAEEVTADEAAPAEAPAADEAQVDAPAVEEAFAVEEAPEDEAPTEEAPAPSDEAPAQDFALTNSQLGKELGKALNPEPKTDEYGFAVYDFWYVDATDAQVVAFEMATSELVGFDYTMTGDYPTVNFDSKKRFKVTYEPMADGATGNFAMVTPEQAEHMSNVARKQTESTVAVELESLKGQFATLTEEAASLREFKNNKLADERKQAEDAIYGEFSVQLSEEEIAGVREKASEMSLDDLKVQLFALVGMKAAKSNQFSSGKKAPSGRMGIDSAIAPRSNKSYAHLIEEVRGPKSN